MGWALAQDNLEPQEKLLLVILADHFNDQEGAAWPSQERIATMMGVSDRQVRRIQVRLMDKGYLEVIKRHGQSNLYKMVALDVDQLKPTGHRRPVPRTSMSYTPDTAVLYNSYRTLKEPSIGQIKKTPIPDKYVMPIDDSVDPSTAITYIKDIKKKLRKAQ